MREIKFRGKRLDNGEWVYGNICENLDRSICIQTVIEKVVNGMAVPNLCFPIDIATVGQYTGLKDKNGKEIYEGDIVEWKNLTKCPMRSVIRYIYNGFKFTDFEGEEQEIWCYEFEAIGNIHDHQHLLK